MSGHISGVQARLLERNSKAVFINCDNHSLNLAGVHAAKVDPSIVTFFGTIEQTYDFFSSSTSRWTKMESRLKSCSVKRESSTRWSAREDAVRIVADSFNLLVELVQDMHEDEEETADTRERAGILLNNLLKFQFVCYLQFWKKLLHSINIVQKRLQSPNMTISDAATDMDALVSYLAEKRDNICQESLEEGLKVSQEWDIATERRIRRRKRMPGEEERDASMTLEQEADRVMKAAIDTLQREISERSKRVRNLSTNFGFLLNTIDMLTGEIDKETLLAKCEQFATQYEGDIENGMALMQDIQDCRMLFGNRKNDNNDLTVPETPQRLLREIIKYGRDMFPNLRTAIHILLTIPVSVAGCERSFSKLKLIKNYLRSTMNQDRLSNLALLSIERHKFNLVQFDDVIRDFANSKARKVRLQ